MSVRRRFGRLALLTALVLAAASGCSGSSGDSGSSAGDKVTLDLTWWGNPARAEVTQKAVAAFEAANPQIDVNTAGGAYDGYHDRLSVQIAGKDAPDVMQLQGEFMVEYGNQGALLPLTDVQTAQLDKGLIANGFINDKQLAVPTGMSTLAIVADPEIFEKAGVALPDDSTWTWQDFAKTAKSISDKTSNRQRGTKSLGWDITEMATWTSQRGNELFTEDRKLGATADDFASLFQLAADLVESGAAPSAPETVEQYGLSPEQSGVATGRYAMQLDAVSNLPALEKGAGHPLKLLRLPSTSGKAGDAHMMFVAAQYWSASARTEHPAEAQKLIDFLTNSTEAGKILGVSRSVPANAEIRDAIANDLQPADKTVLTFMDDLTDEVAPSRLAPPGTANFTKNLQRYTSEVLFKRMSPRQAADGMIKETNDDLANAG
jgi:pectin-derived oligosaccharide transport system substrate-binding protein